jgi:hypothetical protein
MPIDLEKDLRARLSYGFGDLTTVGQPSTTPSLLTNEQLYSLSPDRFNFYVQLTTALMSGDPSIVYKTLGIENTSRHQRERVNDLITDIGKELGRIDSIKKEGGIAPVVPVAPVLAPAAPGTVKSSGGGDDYWRIMDAKLNGATNVKEKLNITKQNDNHPIYSPDTMRASMTDRVVFIAMTFALRSFSLTFLEWSLSNRMVNSTETAIVFYVGMYLLMFALWVLIVNVGERDIFFKVAFYFINTQGPRGFIRIVLHVLLQLLLLPIPFILQSINANNTGTTYLSFEDRRRALRLVGNLSFLMWMVSSIVALRA